MGESRPIHQRGEVKKQYLQNPYYDSHHDPYHARQKYTDGAYCEDCEAVVEKGSFRWAAVEAKHVGQAVKCPACQRIQENMAGGVVFLEGAFLKEHIVEIRNLISNVENVEKSEHPLERIIDLEEKQDSLLVRTTYEHLARRIGEAVHRAYKGELQISYAEDEKYVDVRWIRN